MRRSTGLFGGSVVVNVSYASCALLVGLSACTFNPERSDGVGTGAGGGGGAHHNGVGGTGVIIDAGNNVGDAYTGPCRNLECRQNSCTRGSCTAQPCAAGGKTTVSGTVYDPAGKVPLSNVVVYVPNAALADTRRAPSCDRCGARCRARRSRRAHRHDGHFTLENVPVGNDIPLVIQVGKWRRAGDLPEVAACADTRCRRGPDAAAAQPERGAHPEDRAHDRRRRRAGVPAAEDRHRRFRVHAGDRHRARQLLRGRRRHEQVQTHAGRRRRLHGGRAVVGRRQQPAQATT